VGNWFKTNYPDGIGIPTGRWMNAVGSFMNRLCGGFIQGDGIYVQVQSSANGIIISGTQQTATGITVKYGSPTATNMQYNGNIMIGTPTGSPPAGLTVGPACIINNEFDQGLTGIWPITSGTYDTNGRQVGTATSGGMAVPLIFCQTIATEDCGS